MKCADYSLLGRQQPFTAQRCDTLGISFWVLCAGCIPPRDATTAAAACPRRSRLGAPGGGLLPCAPAATLPAPMATAQSSYWMRTRSPLSGACPQGWLLGIGLSARLPVVVPLPRQWPPCTCGTCQEASRNAPLFLPSRHPHPLRYNIIPDLPAPPAPPLNPKTLQPLTADDLAPIFPMGAPQLRCPLGVAWLHGNEPLGVPVHPGARCSPLPRDMRCPLRCRPD